MLPPLWSNHHQTTAKLTMDSLSSEHTSNISHLAHIVLGEIRKRDIDTADIIAKRSREDSVTVRQGQVEMVRRQISRGIGIRVIINGRLGFAHTSDVSEASLSSLVDRAITLAKEAFPDRGHGIAKPAPVPASDELDVFDDTLLTVPLEEKIDRVLRLEKAMLASDPRIARSVGCHWHDGDDETVIANTLGLSQSWRGTGVSIVGQAVAEGNGQMQSGWWWSQARHRSDLDTPEEVGSEAGRRAAIMLGARSIATVRAPVVFDTPVASQVLGVLFRALDGETVRKRSSYLVDRRGDAIASNLVTVIDDGYMPRKLGTQSVDDEGTPARKKTLVKNGILKQFVYDIRGARLSRAKATGNAQRSYGSLPSVGPTNLYVVPGDLTRDDLIKTVKSGILLTRILGSGVNLVTGDVSWGAGGIWIENGELTYPVEGITIAGNLLDLWKNVDAIADDLDWRTVIACPTFRASEMMIGGK